MLLTIINALAPVAFVILLGWLAGRCGIIAAAASSALAVLVLDFCLPADLFVGTASASPGQLGNWRFFVATAVGLLAIYLINGPRQAGLDGQQRRRRYGEIDANRI